MFPALKNAEFLRYGVMHKNTYINSPEHLSEDFSVKGYKAAYFAGQITGVEGYVESTASGLWAAINLDRKLRDKSIIPANCETVIGALAKYVSTANADFQPMNANYGILSPIACEKKNKDEKKRLMGERALEKIKEIKKTL